MVGTAGARVRCACLFRFGTGTVLWFGGDKGGFLFKRVGEDVFHPVRLVEVRCHCGERVVVVVSLVVIRF